MSLKVPSNYPNQHILLESCTLAGSHLLLSITLSRYQKQGVHFPFIMNLCPRFQFPSIQKNVYDRRNHLGRVFGKGNGHPLQYSFLENPRDRGARWAAVYGVTQSQTWLKWLSSSSRQGIAVLCIVTQVITHVITTVRTGAGTNPDLPGTS